MLLGVLLCVSLTFAQIYSGSAFQGRWTDRAAKRNGISGGSTYICIDHATQTAHGQYNGVGLFSGYLWGNTLTGFWYEAGYDRPFGPFELTIDAAGSSFTGTWSYYQGNSATTSATFTWSASKASADKPERHECLAPAGTGYTAVGKYGSGNFVCLDETQSFENTNQISAWGAFESFGNVKGFSPDSGVTLLLSDFYFPDDDDTLDDRYRPENQATPFGPSTVTDDDGDSAHHQNDIPTRRIVVGRIIDDSKFCGYFWEGLYNRLVGGGAICLDRTASIAPDLVTCGSDIVYENELIDRLDTDFTSWILDAVQEALDALALPPVVIVPNDPFITRSNGAVTNTKTTVVTSDGSTIQTSSTAVSDSNATGGSGASDASSLVVSVFVIAVAVLALM